MFRLACLVLGIIVSLLCLELLLRTGLFVPTFDMNGLKIQLSPRCLYKIKPGSREDINRFGFRGKNFDPRRKKPGVMRILFLGDSFVFGTNVAEKDSIPRVLGDMLGSSYEVINMGVIGYGPDQSLVRLMDEGFKWNPDRVILGIYAANDFADIDENQIFEIDKTQELSVRHPNLATAAFPEWKIPYWLRLLQGRFYPGTARGLYDPFDPISSRVLFETFFGDYYDY
ncbi:MAG: hypothetical protein NC930_09795, partial [Candidatus Omnitrophica bacterium]|nr:hypothetical protein [Candidatus Omnitrophota bacterium]